MAEKDPKRSDEMDNTRREQFIQDLLDSGRKSGEYLDGKTTRLPVIPPAEEPQQPEDAEGATMRFTPVADTAGEDPAQTEERPDAQPPADEVPLDQFFDEDDEFAEPADEAEPEEDTPESGDDWDEDLLPGRSGGSLMPTLKAAIYIISVLMGAVVLALLVWLAADDVFGLTDGDRVSTVTVAETDSIADVAQTLKDAGLIKHPWLFRLYCSMTHAEKKIDPGVYELNDYYDYMALVNGMIATSGARKTVTVTIPEGYEVSQILQLLADNGTADYDDLCDKAANYPFDYDFLADIPYGEENRLEGYLFPDTYEFYLDDTAENVLGKFLRNFDSKLTDDLYQQLDVLNRRLASKGVDKPLTLRDVLTVASMIEKEAASASERTSIASVIYNRLCSDNFPYLQIDATVQYALGERKPVLSYDDLSVDSPYNTYLYEGLPAGPIACPGMSSIKAALYPADTEFYYYALDADGTHHFSRTRQEHEQFLASLEGDNS